MKHLIKILTIVALAFLLAGCIDKGGYKYGVLPDGVVPVEGEALQARNAVYNTDLSELTVHWRSAADPRIYKGVEVSYTMLSGSQKTVKIYANKNFPASYERWSVLTVNPETVNYRCIWINENGNETVSEWSSVDDLPTTKTTSSEVFAALPPTNFTLVRDKVSDEAWTMYESIVGKGVEAQEKYYRGLFQQVVATLYNSVTDYTNSGHSLPKLKVIVGKMDLDGALAYVSGDADGPFMRLGSDLLESMAKGLTTFDYANFEIRGVLIHEFTHVFQNTTPYYLDGGEINPNFYASIEGMADAVRCACKGVFESSKISTALNSVPYYDESRREWLEDLKQYKFGPYVWQIPYGGSGFFMQWLRYYDGDFLRKLTSAMTIMGKSWSMENAVKYILGEQYDIESLWNEYIDDIRAENTSKQSSVKKKSQGYTNN